MSELFEVDIFGIVTTMTADECRGLAARLLRLAGDPLLTEELITGTVRQYDRGYGFVALDGRLPVWRAALDPLRTFAPDFFTG